VTLSLILPGSLAVALGATLGLVSLPIQPRLAARLLTMIAACSAAILTLTLVVIAVTFALSHPAIARSVSWCPRIPVHHEVNSWVGVIAIVALLVIAFRVRAVLRLRRRAVAGTEGRRICILETAEPLAFAAPGRPGCVAVSTGLLAVLAPRERQAMFAHERAHLRQGHSRYLLAASLSVAAVPLLKPLFRQLQFATERSADEEAVIAVGGDRRLVASAIARAALATSHYQQVAASFGGSSVSRRLTALHERRAARPSSSVLMLSAAVVMTSAGASSLQVHHFVEFLTHICGT
jgi:Zn-dependent protease with chaperone function